MVPVSLLAHDLKGRAIDLQMVFPHHVIYLTQKQFSNFLKVEDFMTLLILETLLGCCAKTKSGITRANTWALQSANPILW